MAPSVADEILLKLNTQVAGTGDVQGLSRSITQLTAEMTATGNAAKVSETKLELIRDELLRTAQGFKAGSREAATLAQAAAQVQTQLTRMASAEQRAAAELEKQAAAARRAAQETERQAAAGLKAAQAAEQQARAQQQANSFTGRVGTLATEAGAGLGLLRGGLLALVSSQIIGGLRSLVSGMTGLTDEVNQANSATLVFEMTVRRFGLSLGDADAVAERLAKTFGVSVSQIKDAMATMIRSGARDLGELETAMKGAGASAILAGRQATDGFDGLAAAVATGLSNSLNGIGIAENVGPALKKAGDAAGKTADELDDVTRASTVLGLVSKATATEVEALPVILNDYTRAQAESKKAATELRQEIGTALMPVVTTLTGEVTKALRATTDWARENRGTLIPALKDTAVVLVDAGNAVKVVLAFIADLGTAVGGVATVLVGFGLTVAAGLKGGIDTALSEIRRLFQTGLESLAAFQTAWNQLKAGDLAGAWKTIAAAAQNARDVIMSAPGNILNGAKQGAQFGVETVFAGAGNLNSVGDRTNAAIAQGEASGARVRGALAGAPAAEAADAAQKFTYDYISRLKDVYKNDPKVASDCAAIASLILNNIGAGVKSSANAGVLEQNARVAGFQKVAGDEIKPGDLIVWTSGNGKTYGMTSGKHVGVAAGYKDGKLQVINNPGQSNTVVEPMYDRQNAVAYRAPTSPFARGALSPPPAAESVTFTDAQVKRARELEAAITAAVKANDPKAWNSATAALKRWEDQSKSNAAALEAVRATAEKTARGSKDATEAQIQAQIAQARRLADEEARIRDTGTRAQREALDARLRAFTEGGVAQREALERARRALSGESQMRDQAKREAEKAEREAETRTQNRLKTQQGLQDALARGDQAAAARALASLKNQQADEVRLAGENLGQRAQVIAQSGPAILAAEDRLANLRRDQAVKNAQRDATAAGKLPGADLKAIELTRVAAVREAYRVASADRANARRDQRILEQQAGADLDEQAHRQAETQVGIQKTLTDKLIQELRDRNAALEEGVRAGNEALASLDQRLMGGRDLAQQAQALIPAEKTFAALQIRIQAMRAELQTPGTADAWIQSIEAMGAAGRLTGEQVLALKQIIQDFNDAPGLKASQDAQDAADVGNRRYGDGAGMMDAALRQSYGLGDQGFAAALKGYGVRSMDELEKTNKAAADSVRRVYGEVLDAMEADMRAGVERSRTLLENYAAEAERIADEVAATADQALNAKDNQDADTVARLKGLGPGMMLNFLGGAGNAFLGDKFTTQLGASGREAFLAELNKITPEEFSRLPEAFLKGFRARIENAPEWADLRATIDDALSMGADRRAADQNWMDFGTLIQGFDGLDASSAQYSQTLQATLPKLSALAARIKDPELQKAIADTITLLNGESDALRGLAQVAGQQRLSTLERQKASGTLSEGEYIDRRQQELTRQEQDAWLIEQQGKTGAALELAEAQHQARLDQITQDGLQGRRDLNARLAAEALSITRQGQARELEERRRGGLPELQYLKEKQGLAEQGARDEFDARVRGLKAGSPEYIAAEQALQNRLSQIAADGAEQRAQADAVRASTLAGISQRVNAVGRAERPYEADIQALEAMKATAGPATAQIVQLLNALRTLQAQSESLATFNRYADYIAQVGVAFTQVGAAVGGDLGANISGFGVALQKGVDIAKDIASGNWFGAAMKAISALADAWGGYRRAQEEAAKAQKEFLGSFSLIDASTFSSFTTRSRGFFADLFGGGPEVVKNINEATASIAKTIESGVLGGFQNGIKAFLNGTGNLLDGIREGVRGAIIDAITQAVIQGAVIKGALGKLLTELTNTLADGGDASGVIAQIGAALPGIAQGLERTLAPLKDTIDRALPKTQTSGTSGGGQTFASGTSTLQAGTPQVVIDVLGSARDLLRGANEASRLLVEAARKFDGGVDRFVRAVDHFSGPHTSSTAGAR